MSNINSSTGEQNPGTGAITYNHLNLPVLIHVKDDGGNPKGTISYTYEPSGNKVFKTVVELASASNDWTQTTTTTSYFGEFIYASKSTLKNGVTTVVQNEQLQFISHEEGRIRFETANPNACPSPLADRFVYDYMLKDHLGNVRMVLTEEEEQVCYPAATMETASQGTEESVYANLPQTRVDKPSGYPYDAYLDHHQKVAKVRGDGQKIGPALALKVMAGDRVNIRVSSWWQSNSSGIQSPNPLNELASALASSLAGVPEAKATTQDLNNNNTVSPGASQFLSSRPYDGSKPKAYLSWVLLDEQLKPVITNDGSNSGVLQVGDDGALTPLGVTGWALTRSGYLYVYVSNETPNVDVYFDNLSVTHRKGLILEETHYYPFGLTMAGISTKSPGTITNKCVFNGKKKR